VKESISTSYLFTAVIVIVGLCALIVIGGLSFSKAFKIKNRMIEIIEKHETYDESTKTDIDELLNETGYPVLRDFNFKCPQGRDGETSRLVSVVDSYKYCVYEYETVRGRYYSVVTYMQIEIPLLGDFAQIQIPIYGDTKIFLDV
jgi:hypothetical protein